MFEPFIMRDKRGDIGCYGAVSICLDSRAVYIATKHNLDTDSSI